MTEPHQFDLDLAKRAAMALTVALISGSLALALIFTKLPLPQGWITLLVVVSVFTFIFSFFSGISDGAKALNESRIVWLGLTIILSPLVYPLVLIMMLSKLKNGMSQSQR
jgi:hypothetical protein